MTCRSLTLAIVVFLLVIPGLRAQGAAVAVDDTLACRARPVQPEGRPRIGLALGGGGARGIAHISVLRKLEELQVPIDCIAGTSMGALVGAMYASGMGVDEIERTVLTLDWTQLFDDSLTRRERSFRRKTDDTLVVAAPGVGLGGRGVKMASGLMAGERISLLFGRMIEPVATIEDFNLLPIPYRAVAADINTGEALVIGTGDLALAMRASMSLPGIFPPVQIGEQVVVDGGVARNVPVDVVRNMGADIVIAVDVGTPLATMTTQSSVLGIASQLTGLLTVRNTREQLATLTDADVLVSPPLGDDVATRDFAKGRDAIAIGARGAALAEDRLRRLAVATSDYAQHRATRVGRATVPPTVQFVRVDNNTAYRDEVLLSHVDIPLDQPLDSTSLETALYRVYGLGTLSQSTYEVVTEQGRTGVVLHFDQKIQGPNYLEAGVSMSTTSGGGWDFNMRLGVLQSPVNDRGGELRYLLQLGDDPGLLAEYFQPLSKGGRQFFASRVQYESHSLNVYDGAGQRTSAYDLWRAGASVGVGLEFGNYGAITMGVRRNTGEAEVQVGAPGLPDLDFDSGEAFVEVTVDRLDSVFFPRDGYLLRANYTFSRDSLGADTRFDQFDLDAVTAASRGPHSILLGLRYHTTGSGVAPVQSLYRLGGYSRLVGFQRNELTGQDYAVLLGGYSFKIGQLLNQEALVGTMLEYGNAWQSRSGINFSDAVLNGSVYIGMDSWIGPILLGVGAREGGEHNLFFEVGHRF